MELVKIHAVVRHDAPPGLTVHGRRGQAEHGQGLGKDAGLGLLQGVVKITPEEQRLEGQTAVRLHALPHHGFAQGHLLRRVADGAGAGQDLVRSDLHGSFKRGSVERGSQHDGSEAERFRIEAGRLKGIAEGKLIVLHAPDLPGQILLLPHDDRAGQAVRLCIKQPERHRHAEGVFRLRQMLCDPVPMLRAERASVIGPDAPARLNRFQHIRRTSR